jgi:hypothetical protein
MLACPYATVAELEVKLLTKSSCRIDPSPEFTRFGYDFSIMPTIVGGLYALLAKQAGDILRSPGKDLGKYG